MNRPNRTVAGLDVHKDSVFLCIIDDSGKIFEHKYGVLTPDLDCMSNDMHKYGVTELAMEAGFTSMRTFHRVFGERYRMSPREYRKRRKNGGGNV